MKANEAPKKIYLTQTENGTHYYTEGVPSERNHIEYIRTDAFIEKAKKWFERYTEWRDINGIKHCDMKSFEDFRKYMEGE